MVTHLTGVQEDIALWILIFELRDDMCQNAKVTNTDKDEKEIRSNHVCKYTS